MSHCDNCHSIDRLERLRQRSVDDRLGAMALKDRLTRWGNGKGLARFFFSLDDRTAMWEGAQLVIKAAEKRIEQFEADIERAERARPAEGFKSLVETMNADLKFEDRLKDTKLTDLPNHGRFINGGTLAKPDVRAPEVKLDDLPDVKTEKLADVQDHSAHQGTHYVGDTCPGKHEPAAAVPHDELLALYKQLLTPELKAHVEAALDAAVERGIDLTVGKLAIKKEAKAFCGECRRPLYCHCGLRHDEPGHGTKACRDPNAPVAIKKRAPKTKR